MSTNALKVRSLYEYDPSGMNPENKVENETVVVRAVTGMKDYSYFCPRGAPFYADSLVIKDGKGPGARTLIENVDYWVVVDFISASVHLGKRICSAVALFDERFSGTLYVTYQALGGNFSLDDFNVMQDLIRDRYDVRHVSYEQIINLPAGFAPDWHTHTLGNLVGVDEVVTQLNAIREALEGRQGSYAELLTKIDNHLSSQQAHSPSNVGLGNVKNYGVATRNDIQARRADKYVTADMLAASVDGFNIAGSPEIVNILSKLAQLERSIANAGNGNTALTSTINELRALIERDYATKVYVNGQTQEINRRVEELSAKKYVVKEEVEIINRQSLVNLKYVNHAYNLQVNALKKTLRDGGALLPGTNLNPKLITESYLFDLNNDSGGDVMLYVHGNNRHSDNVVGQDGKTYAVPDEWEIGKVHYFKRRAGGVTISVGNGISLAPRNLFKVTGENYVFGVVRTGANQFEVLQFGGGAPAAPTTPTNTVTNQDLVNAEARIAVLERLVRELTTNLTKYATTASLADVVRTSQISNFVTTTQLNNAINPLKLPITVDSRTKAVTINAPVVKVTEPGTNTLLVELGKV